MNGHIPVVKIGPVLMVSIQTELHDRLAEDLQIRILGHLHKTGAPAVIIDITALEMVDSFIGRVLSETDQMAKVMNKQVVLVGMNPAVTMTLLEMGLALPGIDTAMDVEAGLRLLGFELRRVQRTGRLEPEAGGQKNATNSEGPCEEAAGAGADGDH